jgi:GDPmannose 4,6-dehydratase
MRLMLQQDVPDDYVLSTGKSISVKSALTYVCELAGLDINKVYKVNTKFMRPAEVPYLCGDSSKAKKVLGWNLEHDWESLLRDMYNHDSQIAMREVYIYR